VRLPEPNYLFSVLLFCWFVWVSFHFTNNLVYFFCGTKNTTSATLSWCSGIESISGATCRALVFFVDTISKHCSFQAVDCHPDLYWHLHRAQSKVGACLLSSDTSWGRSKTICELKIFCSLECIHVCKKINFYAHILFWSKGWTYFLIWYLFITWLSFQITSGHLEDERIFTNKH